jgi:hypothetical protein
MPLPTDPDLLAAALIGYQEMRKDIDARMSELRARIGGQPASAPLAEAGATKRSVSPAARRRMAAAQKRRWAAARKAQAGAAATQPKTKKRHLSPEGRARIIAATKRRWAALRKAKAAKAAPKAAAHAVKPAAALKRPARKAAAKTTKPAIVTKKAARRSSSGKSVAVKRSKAAKVQEPQIIGPAPETVAATS